MKSLNRNLTVVSAIWVICLFLTILQFNWIWLTISVFLCPLWEDLGRLINQKKIENKYRSLVNETKKEVKDRISGL